MAAAPLIEATGLVRRYGRGVATVTALNGVDLRIEAGEFVAITGPSGSGKSTLVNLIGLLDAPTAGVLRFRADDVGRISANARARIRNRHVGFVFQAYHLLSRRSARGNVELPLLYAGATRAERQRRATVALERVGLADRAEAFPYELSGGEQQRVAIARALVCEPDLVVADEPTGALDSRTSASILALLEAIREEGRTVIVVTHNRDVAARASRLIALADGRITSDGPHLYAAPPVGTP
jgi:putative ABC transport system ATP-binding protein